jgi:proteasome lid subunit RPN8/RPN11
VIRRLSLPEALRDRIVRAARAASPRECCGLIEGVRDGDVARVMALHPARNLAPGADRFEIDPQDQFDAIRAARAKGRAIIGCYHSHPGGKPQPSATDLAGAGEEDFLWLIEADGALAAFVYVRGVFSGLPTGADCVTSSE